MSTEGPRSGEGRQSSEGHQSSEGRHRVRASDPEREQYVTILRAAMSEGRLTLEEGEQRIAAAYASTYRDELPPTTDDLPDGGRRAVYDTPEAQDELRRRARRFFAGRIGVVAVIIGGVLALGAVTHGHFFWPIIPLLFLVFTLRRRARYYRWAAGFGEPWGGPRPTHGPWGGARLWGTGPGHGPWGGTGPWGAGPWGAGPGPGGSAGARQAGGRPDDGEGWGR